MPLLGGCSDATHQIQNADGVNRPICGPHTWVGARVIIPRRLLSLAELSLATRGLFVEISGHDAHETGPLFDSVMDVGSHILISVALHLG